MLKNIIFCLVLLVNLTTELRANTYSNFIFSSAEINQQISQKTIRKIFQDSSGYLWIVTQEGVSRYDGYQLVKFVHDPRKPNSLSSDNVRAIIEDNNKRLWIATDGGGLNLLNAANQTFYHIENENDPALSPLSNRIYSAFIDTKNQIWLGYRDGNFSRFNPDSLKFEHFNTRALLPILENDAAVTSFAEDENYIWLATNGNGLLKLDKNSEQLESFNVRSKTPLFSDRLNQLFIDKQQRLWIASSDAGLAVIDPNRSKLTSWQHHNDEVQSLPNNLVHSIHQDHQQRIWLGTDSGIAMWNGNDKFSTFNTTNGLTDNKVLSILQDPTGVMWLGGFNGITKSVEVPFEYIDSGLSSKVILGFAETESSNGESAIWIATYGGLTSLNSDGEVQQIINKETVPALTDTRVMTAHGDANLLWFGTRGGGLGRLNVDTQKIKFYTHDPKDPHSLSFNGVTSIYIDKSGDLWVGTFGGGLNYLPAGSENFIHYRHDEHNPRSLNSDRVLAIYQIFGGSIVIGTVSGINVLDATSMDFDRIEHQPENVDSLSAPMAWAFYQDTEAHLWVGTQGGGLNKWLPHDIGGLNNSFDHYDSLTGLPSSHVYSILGDDNGYLWLSSTAGLTRLNRQTGKMRHFNSYQGLKENDFNHGASFKDSKGNLYFGGNSGVVRFDPNDIKETNVEPPVVLVKIKKLNEQVWFDVPYEDLKHLEFGYKDYFISFEFAALDYNAPGLNQYRYKLEGLDSDWIELENRRIATFTNLPAGDFTLRVNASNDQGLWNKGGIVLPITVLPPPWATLWAYMLYTLIIILILLYFMWRYRQKRLREIQQLIELEEKVEERTKALRYANEQLESSMAETEKARKIAEQASKEKSDFLAIMSHEIRTPMNGVLGMTEVLLSSDLKPKQQHFAQLVYRSGRLLLDLLNNILDFSKLEAGKANLESVKVDLEALVEEVCDLFSETAYNKGLQINAILSCEPLPQVYADPARLRQIIANLTSNAIKFTEHGEVNVSIKRVPCHNKHVANNGEDTEYSGFVFCVQDTGIGMAPDRQQKVFEMFTQADASTTRKFGGTGLGLAICRQLTTLMNGNIDVQSNLDKGSRFSLEIDLPICEKIVIEHPVPTNCPTVHLVNLREGLGRSITNLLTKLAIKVIHVQRVNAQLASAKNGLWISRPEYESNIIEAGISLQNWICLMPSSQWQENDHRNILPLPIHLNRLLKSINIAMAIEKSEEAIRNDNRPNQQKFKANILVAEDSLTNQEVAKSMLGLLGCETWLADNGEQAVEQVNFKQPDLILMDCQMPVMDGYKATIAIRKNWSNIPIIALTAGMGDNLRQMCLDAGMNDVMSKPFSLSDLEQTLLRFLEKPRHDDSEVAQTKPGWQQSANKLCLPSEQLGNGTDEEWLDMATVDTLLKISKDTGNPVYNRVLDAFTLEAEKLTQQLLMQAKRPEPDVNEIAEIAHALKSMSGNSGAKALYELCKDTENTSIQFLQANEIVALADRVHNTYVISCEKLEAFRDASRIKS